MSVLYVLQYKYSKAPIITMWLNHAFIIFTIVQNSFVFVSGCRQWLEICDRLQFLHIRVICNKGINTFSYIVHNGLLLVHLVI